MMPSWPWQRWALLLVLASIVASLLFDAVFGRIIPLRPEGIRDWLDGLGPWAPLVFIILMMTAIVVSPVPSVPLDIAAGLAFGFVWGTIYVLIGAELGAIIAFLIARKLGRPRLARRLPEAAMTRIDALTVRSGVRALLLMRLLPVFNFDWVSYAAGLTSISLSAFALATLIGMIPPVMAIVAVGSTLAGNPVVAGTIFTVLVLVVLVPLVFPAFKWSGQVRDDA
ncbi:MAG: TVP38/TMEM64 family protein [Chloroflexota bacterium]|nr:TVP38/TMEM64 family protein [Chloroflexota bacterium]